MHSPRSIRLHPRDNVAVVVNDQGVPAGTVFADGLVTVDFVPQSHKVTLAAIAEGGEVIRYVDDPEGKVTLTELSPHRNRRVRVEMVTPGDNGPGNREWWS